MLGADRLAYWARQYGFGRPTGIDLPGEVVGHRPVQPVEGRRPRASGCPGRGLPGGDRPGVRRRDADPAHQRLHGAGQRRQALPPAARPRGRRARRHGHQAVQARPHPQDDGVAGDAAHDAPRGALHRDAAPHVQPRRYAREGGRQVRHGGVRDPRRQGPPAVPLLVRRASSPRTRTRRTSGRPTSQLAFLAFAYDSRTKGNAGTEIAKAFLQLHFHIKKDYLNRDLLEQGQLLPEQLTADARDAGRAQALHRRDPAVRRGGLARLRPAADDLRRAARGDRARDGLHEQRRGGGVRAPQRHDVPARAHVVGSGHRRVHAGDRCSTTTG